MMEMIIRERVERTANNQQNKITKHRSNSQRNMYEATYPQITKWKESPNKKKLQQLQLQINCKQNNHDMK